MTEALEKAAVEVEPADHGGRLDAVLARRFPEMSRSRLQALIRAGQVTMEGRTITVTSFRVAAGDRIVLAVTAPEQAGLEAEEIPLNVMFEDDDLIVIDKPAGLVVHPGAGNWHGTLVNALLAHCGESLSGIGGERRPGIVHRLDKDTSGLLVAAKNDVAHRNLAQQFADHGRTGALVREYDGLVWGVPDPHIGVVDAPLNRDSRDRRRQSVVRSGGRRAVTHYAVRERFGPAAALLTCRLETGRTHQIRVHMASLRHPLIGDAVYGAGFASKAKALPPNVRAAVEGFGRQALHARTLGFQHPRTGRQMRFECAWPADMTNLVEQFRKRVV